MNVSQTQWLWNDGAFVEKGAFGLDAYTHGLHYATGFFEGMRSFRQSRGGYRIFRIGDHLDRFFDSADRMMMRIPFSREVLAEACEQLLARNGLEEGYIRPLAFLDNPFHFWAKTDGSLKVLIMAVPFPYQYAPEALAGKNATVSRYGRLGANAPFHAAKSVGHYSLVSIVARDARGSGFDQAIFLDEAGRLCEALTDNLFIIRRGEILTPSLDLPILAGITRRTVLELIRREGLLAREAHLGLEELRTADEAFTTSTAGGIQSVTHLEGLPIGDGTVGAVTRRIYKLYAAEVMGGIP